MVDGLAFCNVCRFHQNCVPSKGVLFLLPWLGSDNSYSPPLGFGILARRLWDFGSLLILLKADFLHFPSFLERGGLMPQREPLLSCWWLRPPMCLEQRFTLPGFSPAREAVFLLYPEPHPISSLPIVLVCFLG